MKFKREYFILLVIIIALSVYLILRKSDRTHYQLPIIPIVDSTTITKIEISKNNDTLILKKKGNSWHIDPHEYLAETSKVKSMLEIIENLKLTALVSESKNYDRYDLNEDKKIVVKALAEDTLSLEFEIGKTASSYGHTFVKLSDDHRVYHAQQNFRSRFDQTADGIRDKTVLKFDQNEIKEIQITKGSKILVLSQKKKPVALDTNKKDDVAKKAEMIWQSSDGKEADESKLSNFINMLSNLNCEKYIEDKKKDDFEKPLYTLLLKGNQDYTLSIFAKINKDDKNYPAVSSENDYPFMLSEWQADSIMKKQD